MPPGGGIFLSYNRETGKAPQGTASSTTAVTVHADPTTFRHPPVGAGFHPRPDAVLSLTSRCRSRPVGDGVLDVPLLRSPPASLRSADPRPGVG